MNQDFFGLRFAQDAQRVGGGIARVHNQRHLGAFGGLNMRDKAVVLPCQIAAAPMVIQPRFANADYFGMRGVLHQFVFGKLGGGFAIGMHAHASVDIAVRLGKREHFGKGFAAHADGKRLGDLVLRHVRQQLGDAVGKVGEIDVAMGIYQVHGVWNDGKVCAALNCWG